MLLARTSSGVVSLREYESGGDPAPRQAQMRVRSLQQQEHRPHHSLVTGVILAGGQSRRMGGGDKGLLQIGGQPMLAHVVCRFRPQVGSLVINANGDPSRFASLGLPVVPDTIGGFVGPLAGLHAGMRWSQANAPGARWVATAAADAPLLPPDLVANLMDAVAEHPDEIALAKSNGEVHPVIGLWPVALADDLEEQLGKGVRKVLHWTERHRTAIVPFEPVRVCGLDIDPFFNANTPPELDQLRAMLAKTSKSLKALN